MIDTQDRLLLVRFEFPTRTVWAAPGGGIEPGETTEAALRRELEEEAGLTEFELGPLVWERLHIVPFIGGRWDGQREQYHLVRVPPFEPAPRLSWAQLNREHVFELRWWTQQELEAAETWFAPRRLPELARALVREGPPAVPVVIEE